MKWPGWEKNGTDIDLDWKEAVSATSEYEA
jgi:hypothetical protein